MPIYEFRCLDGHRFERLYSEPVAGVLAADCEECRRAGHEGRALRIPSTWATVTPADRIKDPGVRRPRWV